VLGLLAQVSFAGTRKEAHKPPQTTPRPQTPPVSQGVTLDTNEAVFTVLTAINTCGYDFELGDSDPMRAEVRQEVAKAVEASKDAQLTTQSVCASYKAHELPDPGRTLAQYVSLALFLTPPPALAPRVREADLAPDAFAVLSILPPLQKWYEQINLHAIWERHQNEFTALLQRYHEPLSSMLFGTEMYLRLPTGTGYAGKGFTVYLDPMGPPGQTNARNYGADYFVVISPGRNPSLKMEQIRHTYLHFLLDSMANKYPIELKRLEPLLNSVRDSPMEVSFRTDIGLLVTECLIRAIEARTTGSVKAPEAERQQLVQSAVRQGFILTPYFYKALLRFEKDPVGVTTAYSDMLNGIDVGKQEKLAASVTFAATADPEVVHLAVPTGKKILLSAEQRLAAGDAAEAKTLAQQALDEKTDDPGNAFFILAQAAIMSRDIDGARTNFERAIDSTHEPRVLAWSHIYLGRICDLQEDRESALSHYRAALSIGASLPGAKAAAERGIQQPYEPHSRSQ
jgi:hypothetical protein